MPFRLKKEFRAGKKSKVLRNLCLIERKNGRAVIVLNADFFYTLRIHIPGLFPRHPMRKKFAAGVGDAESQEVFRVVLDGVPARRPRRKAEVEFWLADIFDVRGYMKLLRRRICKQN